MNTTETLKEKLKLFLKIMLPVLVTQLGMFSMTFADTVMSGNYSADDLAGVAIGSSIWVPINTGLSGILLAITPIVSQLVGAKKKGEVPAAVIQGSYLALIISILVLMAGFFSLNPLLNNMQLEPYVRGVAHDYLLALAWGIIPLFLYSVLRAYMDALGQTRVSMFITLIALPINVALNFLFIYGKWNFPELGGVGSGVASAITYWVILAISILVVIKVHPFKTYGLFSRMVQISPREIKLILTIGIPIGLSIFFETSIFSAVTLLMSSFDTITIASHQTAMNFSSFLYMVPLSISMAMTIVVGFEVGGKRYRDAKQYSRIGTSLAVSMALLFGIILFFFRTEIAGIYSKDPEVISLASSFLIYALFFQLSDAIMAPIQGALRGYKDVNITFIMSLVSFWIIGLPTGYSLANFTSLGAYGYWIGLIIGLAVGALSLASRLFYVQTKKFPQNKPA
ncbi:MATE family efflux transporter [Bacillus testis]|uniref:MATE family efflux transporter n=1 Tax=Bacillus testis TaxID=1622072 RepID=UPI00067E9617|nr:MATE family efflux transporter [Bacillus testis]